jgi:catechol 1,2-dioxygenase
MTVIARSVGLILVLASAAAAPIAQSKPDAARVQQQLIGSYKLISYVMYDEKGTERPTGYTVGQISYDVAGRMSAQLMAKDRPTAGRGASDAERAAALTGYVAYFGRYEIDAGRGVVTHHVEGSVNQGMVGQAMPRWYELSADGQTLYLMTKNGDRVTGRLRWDRHK